MFQQNSTSSQCSSWFPKAPDPPTTVILRHQPPQKCKLHCIYCMHESVVNLNTLILNKLSHLNSQNCSVPILRFGHFLACWSNMRKEAWLSFQKNYPCFPACDELIPWKVTDSCQLGLMSCLYSHSSQESRIVCISLLSHCWGTVYLPMFSPKI